MNFLQISLFRFEKSNLGIGKCIPLQCWWWQTVPYLLGIPRAPTPAKTHTNHSLICTIKVIIMVSMVIIMVIMVIMVIMILLMLNGYSMSILKQKQKSERFPRDQEGSVNGRYMEGFSSCRLSQKISIRHCRWSFKLPPLQFHHTIYPHWNDFSDKPEKLRAAPEHRAAAPPGFARKGLEQPADRFSSIRRKGQLLHNNE